MYRHCLVLAGTAAMVFGVAACGGGSNGQVQTAKLQPAAASTECSGTPVKGGDLVYARQIATQTLNPIAIRNGNGDIFADELLYSGLVRADPAGSTKLEGAVADKWTVSSDGKTYKFHIRPGIKFSDGSPVTAQDVKFSLDRFGDPKVNEGMSVVAGGYQSTRVIDASNVEVRLDRPVAAFLYNISIFPAFIVPEKLVKAQGDSFWKHPVGTGPFKLQEFQPGSHITFARNPYYWEQGKPYLDTVRFNFATDSNSRLLALKSGEAQIADGVPFSQINALNANPKLVLQPVKVPAWIGLSLNHKRKPLADLNVRQAMQYALDRNAINKDIFRGVGTIPNSALPALKYDADAATVPPYAYDVDKAKALMAKSAYPDGFSMSMQYPAGFDYYKQLTLLIQQQLGAIGIKVKLVEEDAATVVSRFTKMDYDVTFPYPQLSSDIAVPDEFAAFYGDPSTGTNGFYTGWSDPSVAKLVKAFASATDEADRVTQWPEIQKALLEQSPVINVIDVPFVNAHLKSVCGTDVNALGADHLERTWLAGPAAKD